MREQIPWYRRNYVVDPRVQLKIVCLLGGIALLCSICICIVTYESFNHLSALFTLVPGGIAVEAPAQNIIASLMLRLGAIVVIMTFTFAAAGIVLTHRLAGPVFKIQEVMRSFLAGEKVEPLQLRKNDEYTELAELTNRLMQGYKK